MKVDIVTLSSLLACKANKYNFDIIWNNIPRSTVYEMAKSKDLPANISIFLSEINDCWIRGLIAANPNSPENIIEKLSADRYSYVRQCVASNPITPVRILTRLLADKSVDVIVEADDNLKRRINKL
jgi:hypothetical protein